MSEPTDQRGRIITGLHCPTCGYDMTGHERSPFVRCPECAGKHLLNDLRHDPPPHPIVRSISAVLASPVSRVLIIVTIVSFAMSIILPEVSSTRCGCYRMTHRESNLRNISSAAFSFASENDDLMPPHLADLVVDGYVGGDLFVDPELNVQQQRSSFHFVSIGSLDYSPKPRAKLAIAMELEDPDASYYRFGDVFFPRFPEGWPMSRFTNPELVLHMWTLPNENGERTAAFFDGHIETIEASRWRQVWMRDMQERIQMGVPVLSTDVLKDAVD